MTFSQQASLSPLDYVRGRVCGHGGDRLRLVRACDHSGHRAYYFLQLDPLKAPQFEKALAAGRCLDLECYGDILASGYGEEVPESVLARMKRDYGWNG